MKDFTAMVIADLHGNAAAVSPILKAIADHKPDILIVCGDITDFGKPKDLIAHFFNSVTIPAFAVPGNCDPFQTIAQIESTRANQLHNKKIVFNGRTFVGFGGANPPSLGTPFIIPEEEIFASLDKIMVQKSILVCHAPPRGHLDRIFLGVHVGSKAIAQIVDRYKPVLVCSAHVHEARGIEQTENCVFINPGPAMKGYFALVKFKNNEINAELLRCY